MKEIELSKGKVALVDDEDFEYLNQWKWSVLKGHNTFYAYRKQSIDGRVCQIYMHRFIMKPPDQLDVDHIDSDGLNNQRLNLRLATKQQNQGNRRKITNGHSKYKGVTLKRGKKWLAQIGINSRMTHLGYFDNEIDAAKAYDRKAKELFGEFAKLNFPEEKNNGQNQISVTNQQNVHSSSSRGSGNINNWHWTN
jgi:hypothetical protein